MATIGKRAQEAIVKYMTEEFIVGYNCLSMSVVLKDMGMNNSSRWGLAMSEKNRERGLAVLRHLEQRGIKVKLMAIPVGRQDWRAPLHVFEEIVRQEQKLSALITVCYESAVADKDYITMQFAMELLKEHSISEQQVTNLQSKFRRMQGSDADVLLFDESMKNYEESVKSFV